MNQHFKHQIIIKRQCTHVHTYRIKNLKKTTHNKTPHCQKGKMKLQNVSRNFIQKNTTNLPLSVQEAQSEDWLNAVIFCT